eukprot:341987_1
MGHTKSKETCSTKVDTSLEFSEFIKDSMNYELFCAYLSYRQSIENILFLQKVTAIYQIIDKYRTLYNASCGNCEGIDNQSITEVLQLKYLREWYNDYERKINVLTPQRLNRYDIEFFKFAFDAIFAQIYNEFIDEGASNQINISCETRRALHSTLQSNTLLSFYDYLHFFDEANYEIYQLLSSTYDHGFEE